MEYPDNPEIYCSNCDWEGYTFQLVGIKCPKCKEGKYIEDVDPEPYGYDNEVLGGGDFNWNKK